MSEAGGEPARDTPVDAPCSDTVGVDGWLREIEDKDGWREVCLSTGAERVLERSVIADAGAVSALGIVIVVSRRVLGRAAEVHSANLAGLAMGVLGSDSMLVGVATVSFVRTFVLILEGDTPGFTVCACTAEISSFPRAAMVARSEEYCFSVSSGAPSLEGLDALESPSDKVCARLERICDDPGLRSVVFLGESTAGTAFFSVVVLKLPAFEVKTFTVSSPGLEVIGFSFTCPFGPFERCPIGNSGRAGVTGPGSLADTFVSLLVASMSSAKDGDGCACGRLRPGGIRGVDDLTGDARKT